MTETRKRFALLGAYEELTEKETFCLKEANFDAVKEVQAKKAKLVGELQRFEGGGQLSPSEKEEFNSRIEILLGSEKENEALLEALKSENRAQFKSLVKQSNSVSKIRKAYGSASNPTTPTRTLKGQA